MNCNGTGEVNSAQCSGKVRISPDCSWESEGFVLPVKEEEMLRFNLKILSRSKVSFKMCAIGDMLRCHCIIFCYEINQNLLQTLSFKTLNPTCIRYYINLATSALELSEYLRKWISDSRIGAVAIICHVNVLSLSVRSQCG